MKTRLLVCSLFVALAAGISAASAEEAKKTPGPNGGRILEFDEPRAEFLVTPERKVQITFLDAQGQPVAPANQVVMVTAGSRSAPTELKFVRSGTSFISENALPTGPSVPAVVQLKANPDAKTAIDRFNVNLSPCPECDYPEYACICGH